MPNMASDWNAVRYDLDKSANFNELCESPWTFTPAAEVVTDTPEEFRKFVQGIS